MRCYAYYIREALLTRNKTLGKKSAKNTRNRNAVGSKTATYSIIDIAQVQSEITLM